MKTLLSVLSIIVLLSIVSCATTTPSPTKADLQQQIRMQQVRAIVMPGLTTDAELAIDQIQHR